MRVLFVSGSAPYPPDTGARLRTCSLLRILSCRHEITLLTSGSPSLHSSIERALDGRLARLIVVPIAQARGALGRCLHTARCLLSPIPYIARAHYSAEIANAVSEELRRGSYDLVFCDSISDVPHIPSDAVVPKIYHAQNVEAVIWERYIRENRKIHMGPILRSQCARVAAFEAKLPRLFEACVVVSEEDRAEMIRRYGFEETHVVKNGVDLDYYSPMLDPRANTVTFIGSLDWRPNQDGVDYLLDGILPLIRARAPDVEVSIVGRRPSRRMAERCKRAGVMLAPDVPDVRPYLSAASVVIVPLRIGGGSRLKILEAMAAGRCVVSTTIGAEGLMVTDNKNILIADTPQDFAARVALALEDHPRREALAAAGRALVEAEYSWDGICRDLESIWARVVGRRFRD